MRVVVDNSQGGDDQLAADVARSLTDAGMDVELRRPSSRAAAYDTAVHLVSAGLVIRVAERPDAAQLSVIESAIRDALRHRPSLRRRSRSVPVQLAETQRVLEWIDVFS